MVFLLILLILAVFLLSLKIKIQIENVKLTIKEPTSNRTDFVNNIKQLTKNKGKLLNQNSNYKIKIKLLVIKFIPIFSTKLTKQKIEKIKNKYKFSNMRFKQKFSFNSIKKIIEKAKIKKFFLKVNIGLESIMLLTFLIPTISTIISIILANQKLKVDDQNYQIKPIYNSGNLLNIEFDGIFELNLIHIIKVIYIKKRSVEKNDRTSNRRTYGYSYE